MDPFLQSWVARGKIESEARFSLQAGWEVTYSSRGTPISLYLNAQTPKRI